MEGFSCLCFSFLLFCLFCLVLGGVYGRIRRGLRWEESSRVARYIYIYKCKIGIDGGFQAMPAL
jgi:hypothetical protein